MRPELVYSSPERRSKKVFRWLGKASKLFISNFSYAAGHQIAEVEDFDEWADRELGEGAAKKIAELSSNVVSLDSRRRKVS